jgi:hypothetical protein
MTFIRIALKVVFGINMKAISIKAKEGVPFKEFYHDYSKLFLVNYDKFRIDYRYSLLRNILYFHF